MNSEKIHSKADESSNNMHLLVQSVCSVTDAFNNLISKISTVGENIDKINEMTNEMMEEVNKFKFKSF